MVSVAILQSTSPLVALCITELLFELKTSYLKLTPVVTTLVASDPGYSSVTSSFYAEFNIVYYSITKFGSDFFIDAI